MTFGKVLRVLAILSVAGMGAAVARDNSNGVAGMKGTAAVSLKGDKAAKGDNKGSAKSGQGPVSVRHAARPQAPIVMGRSVSVHHKTKLHHVKIKPLDSIDSTVSGDSSD